jgi:hypothetical protein
MRDFERLIRIRRFDNRIASIPQIVGNREADEDIVFND